MSRIAAALLVAAGLFGVFLGVAILSNLWSDDGDGSALTYLAIGVPVALLGLAALWQAMRALSRSDTDPED